MLDTKTKGRAEPSQAVVTTQTSSRRIFRPGKQNGAHWELWSLPTDGREIKQAVADFRTLAVPTEPGVSHSLSNFALFHRPLTDFDFRAFLPVEIRWAAFPSCRLAIRKTREAVLLGLSEAWKSRKNWP